MAKTIREELKDMYKAEGGQQSALTNDSQTIQGMIKAINRNRASETPDPEPEPEPEPEPVDPENP